MPFVKKWLRTKHAIVFRLNLSIVQINFFDHTKLVVNGQRDTVTFINGDGQTHIYALEDLSKSSHPSVEVLSARLSYAVDVVEHMLGKTGGASTGTSTAA
jgi:polo-like kinase 1